jgi:hypothetical protein
MTQADEYRSHATECLRMAERTVHEADKVQWLKLAQSWMTLLHSEQHATGADLPRPAVTLQQQQPQKPE